jgi:hypothetical protein
VREEGFYLSDCLPQQPFDGSDSILSTQENKRGSTYFLGTQSAEGHWAMPQ